MSKFMLLSRKSVAALASAALVFSAGVFATEFTPIDDGGVVTIQCIVSESGNQKLCCEGGPGGMTCEIHEV